MCATTHHSLLKAFKGNHLPSEGPGICPEDFGLVPKLGMGAGVQKVMPPPPSSEVHKAKNVALLEPELKIVAKAGLGASPTLFCKSQSC